MGLVLATIHKPVRYSYIGGRVRTKDGLGLVLDGSEALVQSPNPWDVLASDLRRRIARQFNRGHCAEAAETAAEATARLAQRPDDGVARLYSALEKLAKAELLALGIDNSAATPEQVPEAFREDYVRRYLDPEKGNLRFGLMASYELLAALGQAVGERFAARRDELQAVLGARNMSLLVHGWQPVRMDTYEKLLAVTLDFLGIGRAELPGLPVLPEG